MNGRTQLRTQDGFALLEVLLAASLLSIGLFAVVDAMNRCVAAARSIQTATVSGLLLANKAYEFRVEQATDYLDQEGEFPDYPGYTWSRTLENTEIGDMETEGLYKQTISVSWQERGRTVTESIVEYRYLPEADR